ncbi:hypothetical protein F5Y19DRAFT_172627 [Xylariaceae sp. FL1651]|nr:hypothetical protein F5Y19DRAFT_172627 [Xylariaceae sp. FL1651]
MVYCGKPSRGCQMCRMRRIKCDETKPTCNQCAKSRRQCPGYKDEFDLVFRNETKATERRAQKANRKALAQKVGKPDSLPGGTPSTSPTFPLGLETSETQAVMPSLHVPIEQQANCHFISHFILMPQDGRTIGHMDYVLPLLQQAGPDSHLQHAFNACSMAFFNNRGGLGANLHDAALNEYSMALARTNAALRNVETQQSDTTLAAVLLLGMFESISAKQIGMFNWGSHIDGAVQIVKARGKKQIKTKIGLQLFIAVRTLMNVYCLTAGKAPVMGAEWWLDDTEFSKVSATVVRLMIKTSEIRAQVTQLMNFLTKTPDNIELVLDIIRKAQVVDQEVVAWQQNIPEEWQYTTVAWEDNVLNGDYSKAEVFPGRVDVYANIWYASITNSARTVRLIIHSLIVRCAAWVCSPVDYRTTPEYATAASVCRDAITDIIASVPYHLGWHLKRADILQRNNFGTFACGEENHPKGLAGYLLTWPLTCVISQDYVTDTQRAWVLGRMRSIGSDLGVKYAHIMCQLQMRVPSMLIRRDGLMQSPYGAVDSFEKIVAARFAPPSIGHTLNPQQQWEAKQKLKIEQGKAELIEMATKNATVEGAQEVAQRWLRV